MKFIFFVVLFLNNELLRTVVTFYVLWQKQTADMKCPKYIVQLHFIDLELIIMWSCLLFQLISLILSWGCNSQLSC